MQWHQIPKALNIRPCLRPNELAARQYAHYPITLKKLPAWVDNASFEANISEQQKLLRERSPTFEKSSAQRQSYDSLSEKYDRKNGEFEQIYCRQSRYQFNSAFAYDFIPTDYRQLEEFSSNSADKSLSHVQIEFQSKFQSGNLFKVYKRKYSEQIEQFHGIMQNDVNTQGYTQWYCFSIKNQTDQTKTISMRIVNFVKSKSLYKSGMKPWIISVQNPIWRPLSEACSYSKTNVKGPFGQTLYELRFQISLPMGLTYVSMMPTYTYTRLCQKIKKWTNVPGLNLYFKNVHTLVNNILPILEFIPSNEGEDAKQEEKKWMDTIVITARTHPGQVWSSFLMEQFVNNLIIFHKNQKSKFRYLIIPILNPDGVIYGNFRCDFSGVDLNRAWNSPHKYTQPAISQLKKILQKELELKKAKFFLDLHSHSKNLNIFSYTCAENIEDARIVHDLVRLSNKNRVFDININNKSQEINHIFLTQSQTTYISSKQILRSRKSTTARAFMSQLCQKGNAATVQVSFFGYQSILKQNAISHFQMQDFDLFSQTFIEKLHSYLGKSQELKLAQKVLRNIYNKHQTNIDKNQILLSQRNQSMDDLNEDSDSEPEKYYAPETIKKSKVSLNEGKVFTSRNFSSDKRKGYLKKTENLIQRIQSTKKKNLKKKNEVKQEMKRSSQRSTSSIRNRNISFDRLNILPLKEEIEQEQKEQKEEHRMVFSAADGIQDSYLARDNASNCNSAKVLILEGCIKIEEINQEKKPRFNFQAIDLSKELNNKIQPTFGKFVPTGKRCFHSKRYKTFMREERLVSSKGKQARGLTEQPDSQNSLNRKYLNINIDGSINNTSTTKNNNSYRMDEEALFNLNQRKNSNKYVEERKKIISIMQQEVRAGQQGMNSEIEEIVNRRIRAKTECETPTLENEARASFGDHKMRASSHRNPISLKNKQFTLKMLNKRIINMKRPNQK